MKILIVEDDLAVAQSLQLLLKSYNYATDIATDGEAALQMADAFEYHLVLLDVLLPRLSGIEVCRQLRKKGFRQPILLLTGQGETQQKAIALNTGADDYVVKPFDNDELIARIQALLRRGGTAGEPILTWGQLSLDPNTCRVAYRDQLLVLTPKEYAILELFLRQQETVFSARNILDLAWKAVESPGEEAVRGHIKDLRQKLTAVGAPKDLIKTVYRVGYRLNPLYASATSASVEQSPNITQVAELRAVNEELRAAMEQLKVTQAELQQKNQELEVARGELEQRIADSTAELGQREAFLNSIYHGVIQTIFVVDVTETGDFRYVSFNPLAEQLIGRPTQALQGKTPEEAFGTTLGNCFRQNYERCLRAETSITYEERVTFEERTLWALTTLSPLRNAEGTIYQIVGTAVDISDRKRAEAEVADDLRDTQRLHALSTRLTTETEIQVLYDEILTTAIALMHADMGSLQILDQPHNELHLQTYRGFHPDAAAYWQRVKIDDGSVCSTAFNRGERVIVPDVETCDFLAGTATLQFHRLCGIKAVQSTPLLSRSGRLIGMFSTHWCQPYQPSDRELRFLDLLARQAADLIEHRQSELEIYKFVSLSDNSFEFIGMCDMDFTPFYINDAGKRMVGLADLQQFKETHVQDFFFPEDQAFILQEFFPQVLREGSAEVEIRFRHFQTGEALWMIYNVVCIRDQQGEPIALATISRNISDYKQLETAMQASEERLRLALDLNAVGVWEWQVGTGAVIWSDYNYRLLGYQPGEVGASYALWHDSIHPDDLAGVEQKITQALADQTDYEAEFRVVLRDGSIHWLLGKARGIYDADGQPVRMIGLSLDISDRKRVELALQERERLFSTLAEAAPVSIFRFDSENNCVYVNDHWSNLTGRPVAEALGMGWVKSLHPEDRDRLANAWLEWCQHSSQGELYRNEGRCLHPDGKITWYYIQALPEVDANGETVGYIGTLTDITNLKQTEVALKESQHQLQQQLAEIETIYQSAPIGLNVLDRDLRFVRINRRLAEINGLSVEAHLGRTVREVVPDLADAAERLLRPILETGEPLLNVEIVGETPAQPGVQRTWVESFLPLKEGERIIGINTVCEEITERKQAELALQQQLQREQLITEISLDIRQSLALNHVLSRTVERVREMLTADRVLIVRCRPDGQGNVVTESVGAEWTPILSTTIFDPCFRDHYIEPYRQGRVATMSDIGAADLEPCYVELLQQFQVKANLVIPIVPNEHLWGLLIVHQCAAPRQWQSNEITALQRLATQVGIAIQQSELYQQLQRELDERKQAEQKIREQAALLDISTDAIMVCDLGCRILYWNQGAEHLYGWTTEEALGQKANELLSRNLSTFVEMKHTVLEQGTWHGEIHRFTKTGNEVIVEGRCSLVRDGTGQPKSILSVDTDITEKKSLEAQFYQAQRLESLGTLTSGIAHDLNNSLTPILSIAQLLRMQPGLNARSQEMLQLLEDSAKRGANMVKQILTFTRGTGGKRTPVDVAALLQEVVKVAQQTFPKFITVCATTPAQEIRRVSADATQLHQVLMNLCVNARDAMPTGGMLTLSVENFNANEIFAQMNLDAHVGPYVLITVADTGTGIAPKVRDRIFDPFFTTKALGQGTGLGLSTVLGIVRSYDGFIQIATEVGQGTQFKVFLPAIDTDAASHLQETALPQGQGEWILVIDDEVPILQSTRAILETHHYQVLTASNGAEAISTYAQHQQDIELVLVDMMMPNMDGVMVIRMLQEINPQVQAIAVSGLLPHYQNSLETLGIKTHLNKPYTAEDLLNSIHRQLHPEA